MARCIVDFVVGDFDLDLFSLGDKSWLIKMDRKLWDGKGIKEGDESASLK